MKKIYLQYKSTLIYSQVNAIQPLHNTYGPSYSTPMMINYCFSLVCFRAIMPTSEWFKWWANWLQWLYKQIFSTKQQIWTAVQCRVHPLALVRNLMKLKE